MAPSGSPPAPHSPADSSQEDQQTTSPASPQQAVPAIPAIRDVYSYFNISRPDAPCPRPNPPGVSGVASKPNSSSTSPEQSTAAAGGSAARGNQRSQSVAPRRSSLIPASTEDWNELPLLQSFVDRIPEVLQSERTRPPVRLNLADHQSTTAKFKAVCNRHAGVQLATTLYSRYIEDIGVARLPITIGKATLFFLSRLPHDTRARQTLELHTLLCAETSQQVPLEDLFDGLLADQTELRAAFNAIEAEMICSDPLLAGLVKMSKGVQPPKPIPSPAPPPPSAPTGTHIADLDALVTSLSARPHMFRPRQNLQPDLRKLALAMYPLSALSKTSGASVEEREAVFTVNSYIDFMDSTHIDSFPVMSITAMLYLLRISNLPASARLVEVLPPWIRSHPRFLPSQPQEPGPKLLAHFKILQRAHLNVWTAWRNIEPDQPLPIFLAIEERFGRVLFRATRERKARVPVVAPPSPPTPVPVPRAAPRRSVIVLQPQPQPKPTPPAPKPSPGATLIPLPTAPPVSKRVSPPSTEQPKPPSLARPSVFPVETELPRRKSLADLAEVRQEKETGEVKMVDAEGEVKCREEEKRREEDAMEVEMLAVKIKVEVQEEVLQAEEEQPPSLPERTCKPRPINDRPQHLPFPEESPFTTRRLAPAVPTRRPPPPPAAPPAPILLVAAPSTPAPAPPPALPPAEARAESQSQPQHDSHVTETSGSGKSMDIIEETEDEREESVEVEVELEGVGMEVEGEVREQATAMAMEEMQARVKQEREQPSLAPQAHPAALSSMRKRPRSPTVVAGPSSPPLSSSRPLPAAADVPPSPIALPSSPPKQRGRKRRKLPPGLVVDFGKWLEGKRREVREREE